MPVASIAELRQRNVATAIRIDERTCLRLSAGGRFDLGLSVSILAERAAARAGSPAAPSG